MLKKINLELASSKKVPITRMVEMFQKVAKGQKSQKPWRIKLLGRVLARQHRRGKWRLPHFGC